MSVDLNKEVYIMMTTEDNTAIMNVCISELDVDIKEHERLLRRMDMDLCQDRPLTLDPDLREWIDKHSPVIQSTLACRADSSSFIGYLKLKRLIYVGIIQKQDFSRLGDLYLKKLKSYLDLQLECGEEMVQLGLINEAIYIKQAIDMKDFYLSIEETLKFYIQCESVYVSNNEIKAVRN